MAVWQLGRPCSWEPEGNIHQCERLLGSFWDVIGRNDDDYPVGYQVNATREWISAYSIFNAKHISSLALTTWHQKEEKNSTLLEFLPRTTVTVTNSLKRPRKWVQTNFVFNLFWHHLFLRLKSRSPTKPGSNKKAKRANTVYDGNIQPRTPKKVHANVFFLPIVCWLRCFRALKLKSPIKPGSSRKAKRREMISESVCLSTVLLYSYSGFTRQGDSDHIQAERRKRLTITVPPRAYFVASNDALTVTRQEEPITEQDNIEDPPSSPDSLFSKKSSDESSPSEHKLEVNPVEDRLVVFCFMRVIFHCGFMWLILLDFLRTVLPNRCLLPIHRTLTMPRPTSGQK